MKPEAQRIAIAEACGWVECDPKKFASAGLYHKKGLGFCLRKSLPDYTNDLNAMHEAEKVFFGTVQWEPFVDALSDVVIKLYTLKNEFPSTVHATAAQRAEAFLRTVGKWEDSE